jgi:hypothetical protein
MREEKGQMASRSQPILASNGQIEARPSAIVEELIGSLCGQIEAAEEKAGRWGQQLMAERKRANEAERRHAEAIAALRPFAELAAGISTFWSGDRLLSTLSTGPLHVNDVRRAAALVTVAPALAKPTDAPRFTAADEGQTSEGGDRG